MLGISTAEPGSSPSRSPRPEDPTSNSARNGIKLVPPAEGAETESHAVAAPQEQRRAIGTFWMLASVAVDAALLWLALGICIDLPNRYQKAYGLVYVALSVAALLPTYRRGRVVRRPAENVTQVLIRLSLTPVVTAALTLIVAGETKKGTPRFEPITDLKTSALLALVGVSVALVMCGRVVMFKLIQVARRRGYDLEDTLIVGAGPVGVDLARALEDNPEFGLVPYGFVDRFEERLPYPIVGPPEQLLELLQETRVRHVVLAFGAASDTELVEEVRRCSVLPAQFYTVPRFFELGVSPIDMAHEVDGFSLVPLRRPGHGHSMWPMKRAFDLVVAGVLLVLTAPIMAACALLVKLSSPGPVFFKQQRVGVNGLPFEIYKFRSMRVNDDHHTTWSVDDDHRVTRVGHILRQTHLDELPQLLNVMRGEMSIVGPRPERPYFVEQFATEIDGYDHRHRVPAGITGWAQVNGYWGNTSIEARVRLDNRYIENWSPWRDLIIALRTIPTLLGRRR